MNKQGFTLAEVLVALGIVGVCAALIAPAIVNIMPDKNKVKVIQYHAAITNATVELLNDDAIYYRTIVYEPETITEDGETVTIQVPKITETEIKDESDNVLRKVKTYEKSCDGGLDCTEAAAGDARYCSKPPFNKSGTEKYAACLSNKLGLGSPTGGTYNDGSDWYISTKEVPPYKITIKVTPEGCGEFSASCKKPNIFKFEVDNWGNVVPVDKLSKVYLKNVTRVNAQKDKEEALTIQ